VNKNDIKSHVHLFATVQFIMILSIWFIMSQVQMNA